MRRGLRFEKDSGMIDMEMKELLEEQNALMKLYEEVEAESDQYKNFQGVLNLLDEQAESNRCLLEGRWLDG